MKTKILNVLLLLSLVACSTTKTTVPSDPVTAEPSEGDYIVAEIKGFNDANKAKIEAAVAKANVVVKSKCFEDFMLARDLKETGDRTRQEVVDYLRSLSQAVVLNYYYRSTWLTSATAYGYASDPKNIYINWAYYGSWNLCARAGGITHETSHKSGFTHDFYNNSDRQYTVPYSINAAFEVCCEEN